MCLSLAAQQHCAGAHTPQPVFSTPPGVCWDAPRDQQLIASAFRPLGWGGANQSQLGAFHLPLLTSNQPHSRVVSCQASAFPEPHFVHPMGAQAHHRAATTVSSGPHCEGAMSISVRGLKAPDSKIHPDAFLAPWIVMAFKFFSLKGHLGLHSSRNQRCM